PYRQSMAGPWWSRESTSRVLVRTRSRSATSRAVVAIPTCTSCATPGCLGQWASGMRAAASLHTWGRKSTTEKQAITSLLHGFPGFPLVDCLFRGPPALPSADGPVVADGDVYTVFGAGDVGLSAIGAAAIAGADPIIAVDLTERKLQFAREFGATHD